MFVRVTCFLVLSLSLINCSDQKSTSDSELVGTWKRQCINSQGTYISDVLDFTPTGFTREETHFADDKCKTKELELKSEGEAVLGDDVKGIEGAKQLDFYYSKVEAKLLTDDAVFLWNGDFDKDGMADDADKDGEIDFQVCGGGWEKDKTKELKKSDCSDNELALPYSDGESFDIYLMNDSILQIGEVTTEKDGTAAPKRPDELDTVNEFVKD